VDEALKIQDFAKNLLDKINESVGENNKQYDKLLDELPKVTKLLEKQESYEKKLTTLGKEKYSQVVKNIKNTQASILEHEVNSIANMGKMGDQSYENLDISQKLLDIQKLRDDLETNAIDKKGKIYLHEIDILNVVEKQAKGMQRLNVITNSFNKNINSSVDKMESFFDKSTGFINMIPGGGVINKLFNTDKVKTKFIDNYRKKLQDNSKALIDGFADGSKEGMSMFQKLNVGAKSFGQSLMGIGTGGLLLGIGLLVGAIVGLVALANKLNNSLVETAKALGISKDESLELTNRFNNIATSTEKSFYNVENLRDATTQLNNAWGVTNKLNDDNLKTQILLTKQLGLSEDASIRMLEDASSIGMKGQDYLSTIGLTVKQLNKQNKTQVNFRSIITDISKLSVDIYNSFKGNTQELVQSVYQAKLLGSNLNDLRGIADNLIDIESSLSDEMEARVMTGKNLNFQTAREMAMQDNLLGMQMAILEQAGSLVGYQNQSRFAREAEAKAAGMSVEQYTKMIKHAEVLKTHGIKLKDLAEGLSDADFKRLKASIAIGDELGQSVLKEIEMEKNADKISGLKDKLLTSLMTMVPFAEKLVTGFTDMVTQFSAWANDGNRMERIATSIGNVFDGIYSTVKFIGKGLKAIHSGLESIFGQGSATAGILTAMMIPIGLKSIKGITKGFAGMFSTISGNAAGLLKGKIFKGGGIMNKLLSKKQGKETTKTATKTFKGLTNLGKSFGSVITSLMKGVADGISKLFEGIQKAITSVSKGISDVLTNVSKGIGNVLTNISKGLNSALTNVSKGLSNVLQNISKGLSDAIMNISKGIGKGFEELMTSAGRGIAGFFKAFKSVKPADILKGALALGVISGAVWLFAKAMKEFTEITWDTVSKGIVALGALTIALIVLGNVSSYVIVGALAMGIMAGALWVLGKAMQEFGKASKLFIPFFEVLSDAINEGISAIGDVIEKVIMSVGKATSMIMDSIIRLSEVNIGKLLLIGPALSGIAIGLAAMTAVSVGTWFAGLFGGNIFDKLLNISKSLTDLNLASIVSSFKSMEDIKFDYIVNAIDNVSSAYDRLTESMKESVEQLHQMNGMKIETAITNLVSKVTDYISPDDPNVTSVFKPENTNIASNADSTYEIKKNYEITNQQNTELKNNNNQLVGILKEMLNEFKGLKEQIAQPAYIKIGDKTVNELTAIQTMKRDMRLGFDNN